MAALLGGQSEIDCHLASSPFYYYERAAPGVHQVFKSYDITGGTAHLTGVHTGLFSSSLVQVAGPGLQAGLRVEVPAP